MKTVFLFLLPLLFFSEAMGGDVVIVTNKDTPALNGEKIARIYTGKLAMMNDVAIIPVDRGSNTLHNAFLQQYLHMDQEKYIAYWTVRQYIGKGTAPRSIDPIERVLEFVKKTRGAVGYVTREELEAHPADGIVILSE